jgi:putative acetyltransferase
MIELVRTSAEHPAFVGLVKQLDEDLAVRDGDEHPFYDQFNKLTDIRYVVLAMECSIALACGAIKAYDPQTMEVKRMYTIPQGRNKGIASKILLELEQWARELGYKKCILETGLKQPEAIALYKKNGYRLISNYGQYAGKENSVCFEKHL